jgi:hypothetical protein
MVISIYAVGGVALGLLISDIVHPESFHWLALGLGPVICLSFLALRRFVQLPQAVRKLDPVVFSKREVVLKAETLEWTYESGLHTRVPWSLVRKVQVLRGIYLIYLPGGSFFQLPRRALTNDQEHYLVDRLREIKMLP